MAMYRLIDTIVIGVWISVLIICRDELAPVLGGSLILGVLLAGVYVASYVYRRHRLALSLTGIILLLLGLFNYLAFLEDSKDLPIVGVVATFCILSMFLIISTAWLGLNFLRTGVTIDKKEDLNPITRVVFEIMTLYPMLSLAVFCIPTSFPITDYVKSGMLTNRWLSYVPIAAFWLSMSFFVTFIALRIKTGIMLNSPNTMARNFSNRIAAIAGGTGFLLIVGSVVEVLRGAWFLWFDTIIFLIFIFGSLWSIRKIVSFLNQSDSIRSLETLPGSYGLRKSLVATIIIYALLGSAYLMALTVFTME
jgi:hypothetical protein